jgi:hypothetical protein
VNSRKRKPGIASQLIGLGGRHPIDRNVLRDRLAERDKRQAADTRTETEKYLGDPQISRSALANRKPSHA